MHRATLTRWVRPRSIPVAAALAAGSLGSVLFAQQATEAPVRVASPLAESGAAADGWGRRIELMQRAGTLRLRSSREDTMVDGRVHDRFDQYAGDVPIFGAQVVRQRSAAGVETVFGELHPDDPGVSTTPRLSAAEALRRSATLSGVEAPSLFAPELFLLAQAEGGYRLVWLTKVRTSSDFVGVFVDAQTGDEVQRYSLLRRQSAVGTGTGVLGDRKKLSTRQQSSTFFADDALRPPSLVTLDMKSNIDRTLGVLFFGDAPSQADIAADTDNTWADGPVVDAHAYLGFTYDYYFQRFGRRGVDNNNRPIRALVHPIDQNLAGRLPSEYDDFFVNAFWCPECGSNQGFMVFGEGIPSNIRYAGYSVRPLAGSFDIVAHELSHAVTSYSADLVYMNESGALNEAFSDMMAVGAEYYLVATGRSDRTADYLIAEDTWTGVATGFRSLANPASFGDPDHYARRYVGPEDNGGVHINSGIPNHAFYLAIEGGTNRTSGLAVQGVGGANREQIEQVFYRGFTAFLTPNATFAQARQATLRAASELYGDSSAAFRAVQQAWTAVGVN
jgi:Zn-dependent metalloprotease